MMMLFVVEVEALDASSQLKLYTDGGRLDLFNFLLGMRCLNFCQAMDLADCIILWNTVVVVWGKIDYEEAFQHRAKDQQNSHNYASIACVGVQYSLLIYL